MTFVTLTLPQIGAAKSAGVARAKHLPHATLADLGGDLVHTKTGAGEEGQRFRDYTGGRGRASLRVAKTRAVL